MNRDQVIHPADAVRYFIEEESATFSEGYVVESTVEVVIGHRQFRLEAYRNIHGDVSTFHVRAYTLEDDCWKKWALGYCSKDSATEAFMQALGFLSDAFRGKVSL